MADRPNFLDLLELDPRETRRDVIEKRIQEKKTAWARDSTMGSPRKRQEAKRSLDLLSELQEMLADPKLWRREAEDALRRRGEARAAREKELQEWIDLLKGSGLCGDEHLAKICRQLEGIFTEKEIRAKLEAAGIRVGSNGTAPKSRPRTDSVTAENIRRNLNLLKLASLYEFLGLASDKPAADLRARGDAILKENQRLGRTDAEATARNDLAGLAKTVFQSDEEKKKYDTHRVLEAVEAIENQIQAAGADGVLSAQELETLIRLAVQRGAPQDEAREILEERAAREGWKVERAAAGPTAPDPTSSTKLGGLRIRRLAAAGLATLVIGCGAAALWWGPLTGILVKPSPRPIVQAGQTPAPGASPGPAPSQPQSPAQTSPTSAPSPGPPATPGPGMTINPQPPPSENQGASNVGPALNQKTPGNAFGNNSGNTTSPKSVLGNKTKLPIVPISPRPSTALPANPEIAVIAMGDSLLASPLEAELEKAFRDEGLDVVSGSAALDSLRRHRGGNPSVTDILASLRGDGVHAVVIAQVDHLADRELSFYGRKDVSSTSRVRIQAYLVDGHRSIGSWNEQIEYTTVNASTEGENAAHRAAPGLANSVRTGWQALRGNSLTTP